MDADVQRVLELQSILIGGESLIRRCFESLMAIAKQEEECRIKKKMGGGSRANNGEALQRNPF